MKNVRKILAVILCAALCVTMSFVSGLTAFAEPEPPKPPEQPPSEQPQQPPSEQPQQPPSEQQEQSVPEQQEQSAQPEEKNPETPSSWAEDEVNDAIDSNLVPDELQDYYTEPITRIGFCALVVNLYETLTGAEITERIKFEDTDDENAEKAASIGVVSGVGGNLFDPWSLLTREQAAVMLARVSYALGYPISSKTPDFTDAGNISSWAADSVGQMQNAGIMTGTGDNKFSPQEQYTIEQSIATVLRLFDFIMEIPEETEPEPEPEPEPEVTGDGQIYTFVSDDFMNGISGTYTGDWKDGKPHGKGVMIYEKDNPYELLRYYGDWVDGVVKGIGTVSWRNGDSYTGSFDRNMKHGPGIYTYEDGTVMEGVWRNDLEHGDFVVTYPEGVVFDVVFDNGEIAGYEER